MIDFMYLWLLPLLYLGAFMVLTVLRLASDRLDKIIFCTTCFSFFAILIIGFIMKFDPIILAFMVGMTVTGASIKLKKVFGSEFVSQLIITIFGLLFIVFALKGGVNV